MNYLYHLVPRRPLVGHQLLPLNMIKKIDLELYEFYKKKYDGREELLTRKITSLDCLWNDVIFLNAIPPAVLLKAYEEARRQMFKRTFYQIDPATLDRQKLTVWLKTDSEDPGSFVPFDPVDLPTYARVPEATLEHYRQLAGNNRTGLMFAYVPHILYKGTIDVSRVSVITV